MTENMVTIQGINGEFTLASWQAEAAYQHLLKEASLDEAKWYVDYILQGVEGTQSIKPTEEDYKSIAHDFVCMKDPREPDYDLLDRIVRTYYELEG